MFILMSLMTKLTHIMRREERNYGSNLGFIISRDSLVILPLELSKYSRIGLIMRQ